MNKKFLIKNHLLAGVAMSAIYVGKTFLFNSKVKEYRYVVGFIFLSVFYFGFAILKKEFEKRSIAQKRPNLIRSLFAIFFTLIWILIIFKILR